MTEPGTRLSGCRIIVTRPEEQARVAGAILANEGAEVVLASAIYHEPLMGYDRQVVANTLGDLRLGRGWLVLPSPMAVETFVRGIEAIELGREVLEGIAVAVIGMTSARLLEHWGRGVDFVPEHANGAALARTLPAPPGTPVIVAGAETTRPELLEGLRERGLRVAHWTLYATQPWAEGLGVMRDALTRPYSEGPTIILVSSPSAVDAIADYFEREPELIEQVAWLSIGGTTYGRIFERGLDPLASLVSDTPYMDAIVEAAGRLRAGWPGTAQGDGR